MDEPIKVTLSRETVLRLIEAEARKRISYPYHDWPVELPGIYDYSFSVVFREEKPELDAIDLAEVDDGE